MPKARQSRLRFLSTLIFPSIVPRFLQMVYAFEIYGKTLRTRLCLFALLAVFCISKIHAALTVASAISMGDAMEEISAAYTTETGEKIRHTFSGTNVLARQIEAGAPIDVFVSADTATMDGLVAKRLIEEETVRVIASNELVVVFTKVGEKEISLKSVQVLTFMNIRIALADPDSVPAGIYAKKWLIAEDVWEEMQRSFIRVQNVRAALVAAENGDVNAAIVYRSDAASSKKVNIALVADPAKTGAIKYPAAIVASSAQQAEAKRFLKFLTSAEALAIFTKHGFGKP